MITVVTGNKGKAAEVAAFFDGIVEVTHTPFEAVEPQAENIADIAREKARQAYEACLRLKEEEELLSSLSTPLALLVLGAQFEFSAVKGLFKEIVVGTVSRVFIAPIVGIGLAVFLSSHTNWLSCGVNEYPSLVALYGSPMAVSAAVMAGQMHNDEQLATQLVVWTSISSIFTIFLTVCIMMPAGLLAV